MNSDRMDMLLCELNARKVQIARHVSFLKDFGKAKKYGDEKVLSVEGGRSLLIEAIQSEKPFMAARFGTSEGAALYEFWKRKIWGGNYNLKYLDQVCTLSGFFPNNIDSLYEWGDLETSACADLDLLGCMNFVGEEWIYKRFCSQARLMPAGGLSSSSKGWAWSLEGKKVLVIHPFVDTIEKQYKTNREKIFPGTNALPVFDLKCVKAVQTISDATDDRFASWFEALDYMTDEASKQDFQIALIGCGAYGFPLASRIKKMGKTAIHMGGSLQTLFGIKGSRWDGKYGAMYNEAWVYPSEKETPAGFEKVEGGCYWEKGKSVGG